jgi:hypothetical protein
MSGEPPAFPTNMYSWFRLHVYIPQHAKVHQVRTVLSMFCLPQLLSLLGSHHEWSWGYALHLSGQVNTACKQDTER